MRSDTIIEYPDERLRQPSAAVAEFGSSLAELEERLVHTLHHSGGIGLCAPQLGVAQRVILVNTDEDGPQLYVNPEILSKAGLGVVAESCLSLPGIEANVLRAAGVCVRAQDTEGKTFEREIQGMHAVCIQHEIDHLNGVLFIDRLFWFQKLRLRQATRHLELAATESHIPA
ncbi:MAG: peptide deformylase [Pseudomonadota bacterium]